MAYLGNTPTTQSFISGTDYFNGTGSQTAFTLSRTVASVNDIQVTVNNVVQVPNDAYTISGTTITFTSAPSAGTQNVYVRYLSTTTQAITPSQGTVSWSTLNSDVQQDLGISFKNRVINGNMRIDQRNAGASVTVNNNSPFITDRFRCDDATDGSYTAQQVSTAPTGFNNSVQITVTSADTSLAASQYALFYHSIEGNNVADLNWGTANAKTVTLSFWVRSSLTGTFSGSLENNANNRSYIFTYSIGAANTWEYKTITIPGDQSGTWETGTAVGIRVNWSLGVGSDFLGTAGAWGNRFFGATGSVSVIGTNGATWLITGVQLEVGTQATTFTTAGGSYGAELALCQRYYQALYGNGTTSLGGLSARINAPGGGSGVQANIPLKVSMRTSATGTRVGTWTVSNCGQPSLYSDGDVLYVYGNASGAGDTFFYASGPSIGATVSAEL